QVIGDGNVGGETEIPAVEFAPGDAADKARRAARGVGRHVDGATDCVRAEQRALRTLENLHAIYIEKIQVRADGTREVHPIQVHADAGVQVEIEVILTDAANRG